MNPYPPDWAALVAFFALIAIGFAWASQRAGLAMAERIGTEQEGVDIRVEGHVVGLPVSTPTGRRFQFTVERCPTATEIPCPVGLLSLNWGSGFAARFAPGEWASLPPRGAAVRIGTPQGAATGAPVLIAGDRWQFTVRLKRPRATDNPGTFDAELRMLQDGIIATGYVRPANAAPAAVRLHGTRWSIGIAFDRARHEIRQALLNALGDAHPDAAGVLVALAVGDQAAVANRWWDIFNRTGVGHLMSISGLHITMLAGLAMTLARWALRLPIPFTAGLLLHVPAPFITWSCGLMVAFVYSGLAGWGIPAQRTCWMLAATAFALLSGRSRGMGAALGLAAAVVTVIDPWAPMAAGFWLSFVAVAAIATHGSAITPRRVYRHQGESPGFGAAATWQARALRRWSPILREATASQWAATLSLLPLGALFFSSYSLVSPIANAVAIPLVSGLITPLVLAFSGLAMLSSGLAAWAAPLLLEPTALMLRALDGLASLPYSSWVLARPDPLSLVLAVIGVAMLLRPHPLPMRAAWGFTLIPLLVGGADAPEDGGLHVHALDVGQGMAVLVETQGFRVLYDTGPYWSAESNAGQRIVVPWLRARGVRRIDLVVVSHPDLDHAGGVHDVLKNFPVGAVLSAIPPEHPLQIDHPNHQACRRGHSWTQGRAQFDVLHPGAEMPPGAARSPTNARSCVLRIRTPAGAVLLPGDLEARQERELVERLGAEALNADILLAPHHGSNTSSTDALIAAVAPRWVVVQAGYRNRFGHPTAKVLGRYEGAGVQVLRSDLHGAISIQLASSRAPQVVRSRLDNAPYWRLQ